MDRKQGASQDLLNEVKILIENNKVLELRELLEEYHIIDIFDIIISWISFKIMGVQKCPPKNK